MERQECLPWMLWMELHAMEPVGPEIISQDTADGHQCWTSFPLHLQPLDTHFPSPPTLSLGVALRGVP